MFWSLQKQQPGRNISRGSFNVQSDYHHYSANRDNIAENKYDGLSIGVYFIDFLINKFQYESDAIPDSCHAEPGW
jgi:hypothetical protein